MSEVITTNEQDVLIQHMIDRLPALRKKYGISQTELGEKIGLSRQTISAIERKTTPLTWTTMLAMLMFFTANSTCVFYFPQRTEFGDAETLHSLLAIKGSTKKKAYARGLGVPANKELAAKWYEKAIENGNTFSEYQYGMKYVLGTDGFEVDYRKGYEYLSHAAQAGQTYAMKPLAELLDDEYIPGLSTEERNSQMIYWFEKAVENGDEWAAVTLGRKYENGYSPVQVDVAKAIHYYQIAADHDIDMVYLSLGKLYMIPGPTANYKLAHRYLSLAQEKSTLDFQIGEIELCYGKMNKDGLGIPKNLEEAYRHFTIAASKGNTDAIEELKHIKKGLFGWKLI